MTDRIDKLKQMLLKSPADAFLLYGLAMEHKKLNLPDEAIGGFRRVIEVDPLYCYAYYQLGQVQAARGETTLARKIWLDGIAAASKKGDAHAGSELQAAIDDLD